MTLVCYNKPNRTNPRKFTISDLERIAGYVEESGVPVWKIFASVAIGIGAGFLVCKAAKAVRDMSTIMGFVKQIALIAASAKAISVLIEWLKRGPVMRIPIINRVAIAAVLVLLVIQKIVQVSETIVDSIIFLEEITKNIDKACEYTRERVESVTVRRRPVRKTRFSELNAL